MPPKEDPPKDPQQGASGWGDSDIEMDPEELRVS